MSRKEKRKQHKRLCLLVIESLTVLFALFCLVNGSYSWYIYDRQISASDENVAVDYDDLSMDCVAYQYDVKLDRVVSTSESTSDAYDMEHLAFQSYDMIFRQKNRYTPMVIKLTLNGLVLTHKNTVDLIIQRDLTKQNNAASSGTLSDYVSSIMRFTAIGNGNADNPYSLNDVWYGTVGGFAGNMSGTAHNTGYDSKVMTLAVVNGNTLTYEKADSVTLSVNYTQDQLVNGSLTVYLYMTYDGTLTSTYERQRGFGTGGTIEGVGEVFGLENDLLKIVAKVR